MKALMVGRVNGKRRVRWGVAAIAFLLFPPLLAVAGGFAYARLVGQWQREPVLFGLAAGFGIALLWFISDLTSPQESLKPLKGKDEPSAVGPGAASPGGGGRPSRQPAETPRAVSAPAQHVTQARSLDLSAALNDFMACINDILGKKKYSDVMRQRLRRMKKEVLQPLAAALRERPDGEDAVRELAALFRAVGEYVVSFGAEPQEREERRKKVEGAKALVRRRLLTEQDNEAEVEMLLDEIRKWQWKTALDAGGRLVYTTPDGKQIPTRALIAEKVGPALIARAVKALQPYSEKLRPRDARGEPGGLLLIGHAGRAIITGDLHGRYDNLERILRDKKNIEDILAGKAHLIFTGDAVHPRSSALNDARAYEDSFCTMLLIMTMMAENPFNVHYLVGNHDHAHIGGRPAGRGEVRQDTLFEKYVTRRWGAEVFEHYRMFVRRSPVAMKINTPGGAMLLVHAGLSAGVKDAEDLIDINVAGPQGEALQELIWSRKYDDRELMRRWLSGVGAKLMIVGHTPPTRKRAERYGLEVIYEPAFAHVHHLQVILNAQNDVFGYLNLDMTRPLPDDVTALLAPDGKSAFRLMRAKRPADKGT